MIDVAFDSLLNQRLHLVLSSDRPLAVQHSATRLLRRLHDTPEVRVAADAPLDPTELIEHVNRIVAGLSIREATASNTGVERLAVLPVRVNAERAPDSIQLLIRLCRALPGSGLRLILIIEHPPALNACLAALGTAAFHWDIRPAAAAGEASASQALPDGQDLRPMSPQRHLQEEPVATQSGSRPGKAEESDAPNVAPPLPPPPPVSPASPGVLAKVIDAAANRPLRFAMWVVGIPGLLIAGALAIGSALQPARAPGQSGHAPASTPSTQTPRPAPAKPSNGSPKADEQAAAKSPATAGSPSGSAPAPSPAPPTAPSKSPASQSPASPAPAAQQRLVPESPPSTSPSPLASPAAKPVAVPQAAPAPSPASAVPATANAPAAAKPAATATANPPTAAQASPPAPPPASPPVNRPASPPAATPAPAAATQAFECSAAAGSMPQLQPRNPSKDGGMVYLTSSKPVIVCVTDGTGALTRAEITPELGGQSFFGKPPWQVQASSLRDLQVFFQGARITLPRGASDRFELIEQRQN